MQDVGKYFRSPFRRILVLPCVVPLLPLSVQAFVLGGGKVHGQWR